MGRARKGGRRRGRKGNEGKEKLGKNWGEEKKRHRDMKSSITGVEGEPQSPASQRSKEESENKVVSSLRS